MEIEILRQSYKDFRLAPILTVYGDPLSNLPGAKELVKCVVLPDEAVDRVRKRYQLPIQLFSKVNSYDDSYIHITIPCIGENIDIITSDMQKLGYFLDMKQEPKNVDDMIFQVLCFKPNKQ